MHQLPAVACDRKAEKEEIKAKTQKNKKILFPFSEQSSAKAKLLSALAAHNSL